MSQPEQLETWLRQRLEELWSGSVEVTNLELLAGGASRQTWRLDAGVRGAAPSGVVLRRAAEGSSQPEQMAREADAVAAAYAAGVPEPALLDSGTDAFGVPYLLMKRLSGETIPRRLLREERFSAARDALPSQLGRALARIHSIDPATVPGLERISPLPFLTTLYTDFAEPRPAVELGLRWLTENQPDPCGDSLVHGDFRLGNLLVDEAGLRGVLDWELVHRGDPAADLGWLCTKAWRFGSPRPVGGLGAREELLDAYRQAGGHPPTLGTLHWWEVYGTVRWALLCRWQAERHLSGAEPSVELAVLGRRVCEQEHDILLALGHTTASATRDPLEALTDEPEAPHDRPGADGLLDAVSEFLATEVSGAGDARLRFHAKVAANAVRIARRETLLGAEHARAHRDRLARLGCADDAELCAAIRTGSLDERFGEVVAAIRETVTDKLVVANPVHLALPG